MHQRRVILSFSTPIVDEVQIKANLPLNIITVAREQTKIDDMIIHMNCRASVAFNGQLGYI